MLPCLTLEQMIGGKEGWVLKKSRSLGEWRPRWLILFRERETGVPWLCTFKVPRTEWAWGEDMPEPTERVQLHNSSCCLELSAPSVGAAPLVRKLSFGKVTCGLNQD